MEKRESYAAAKTLVAGAKRILISGHASPDGDSLGSMIALARLLRNAVKDAWATADLNALGKTGPHKFRRFVANLRREGRVDGCRKVDLYAEFSHARELTGL